jgi:hypothetical protein
MEEKTQLNSNISFFYVFVFRGKSEGLNYSSRRIKYKSNSVN